MLIDIATAVPPYIVTQQLAAEELKKRMGGRPAIGRMIEAASSHSGIDKRHIVISDAEDMVEEKFYSNNGSYISPDTQTRMNKYEVWSKQLTQNAVKELLGKNNIIADQIDRIITISCTGFFAPGLDYNLIEHFNFSQSIKRTNIGFMGCAASLIGFNSVLEAMQSAADENKNTLMISVELCSVHLQTEPTRDNILANMIFADGCAAVLFSKSLEPKFELLWTNSYLFKDSSQFMGWKIGNFGFEMILSSDLPRIILEEASPTFINILDKKNIRKDSIKHWALHPGGRAILDSLQKGIGLSDEQMLPSREILKNYGNMSSASILFVLKALIEKKDIKKDELICCVAFGPGLTMEVALLRGY